MRWHNKLSLCCVAMPFESPSVLTNNSIYLNGGVVRLQDKDNELVACREDTALQNPPFISIFGF